MKSSSTTCLAEWHEQDAIFIAWPHKSTDWNPYLSKAYDCYLKLSSIVSQTQACIILSQNDEHQAEIQALIKATAQLENIYFIQAPYNDTWTRDYGVISRMKDNRLELVDFQFNAWGDKFEACLDNEVNEKLNQQSFWKAPLVRSELTLEGGSIESNGKGTLLATYHCIKERYPNDDLASIEQKLNDSLGFEHFLWLNSGHLAGDDTDAHIDTLARFVDETTIAYVGCDDENDEHYPALLSMESKLKAFRTPDGQAYNLVKLPFPEPQFAEDGHRLPATYANFLIINDAVLMPTYNVEQDKEALDTLQHVFSRPVIGIDCRILIEQHGSLHCATMQLPKGSVNLPSK